ncbi:MAG: hypothetical protein H0V70_21810 [Ktedonobacteraceae bacterium]|nr:hypothetical protein [Ktedonobacteraceae bacterium]
MAYKVMLWRRSTSRQPDVVCIAPRVSDIDDAIRYSMQKMDCGYASAALAYPTDKDKEDIGPDNWRKRVKCLISGKYSYVKDDSWQGLALV